MNLFDLFQTLRLVAASVLASLGATLVFSWGDLRTGSSDASTWGWGFITVSILLFWRVLLALRKERDMEREELLRQLKDALRPDA